LNHKVICTLITQEISAYPKMIWCKMFSGRQNRTCKTICKIVYTRTHGNLTCFPQNHLSGKQFGKLFTPGLTGISLVSHKIISQGSSLENCFTPGLTGIFLVGKTETRIEVHLPGRFGQFLSEQSHELWHVFVLL